MGKLKVVMVGLVCAVTVGVGAVVLAATSADGPASERDGAVTDDASAAPDLGLAEIGDQPGGEVNLGDPAADEPEPAVAADAADTGVERVVAEADGPERISLGDLGSVMLGFGPDGIDVIGTELIDGWTVESQVGVDGEIVLIVKRGDDLKAITIREGGPDGVTVAVEPLVIPAPPTTTTTTEKPVTTTTTYVEDPAVAERITVEAPGNGAFVAERIGPEKLAFVGMVTVAAGLEYEVIDDHSWKVVVRFSDGTTDTYAKAYIDDDGSIQQYVWTEPTPMEPVYQWIEVPEVGAVQLKLWSDGLIYVKEWYSECCAFFDTNEGEPGETARVGFEGDGISVVIEAWSTADGQLEWVVDDGA